MAKIDYYETLGVSKNATIEEIKSAFRKLTKKYHPDVCKDEDAKEKIIEIIIAYEVLSNETKRLEYDRYGSVILDNFDPNKFDFSNIFNNLDDLEKSISQQFSEMNSTIDKMIEKLDAINNRFEMSKTPFLKRLQMKIKNKKKEEELKEESVTLKLNIK